MCPPLEFSDLSVLRAVAARMRVDADSGVDAPELRRTLLARYADATGCALEGELSYYAHLLERCDALRRRASLLSRKRAADRTPDRAPD